MELFGIKTNSEILMHNTVKIQKTSEKTENTYNVEAVPTLQLISIGKAIQDGESWKYSVVDKKYDLQYIVKTSNYVEAQFGTILEFKNIYCGVLQTGKVWVKADSVAIVIHQQRNA